MEPSYDIICILLETPFSRFSDFEKHKILSEGRPTPNITEIYSEKNKNRCFKASWFGCVAANISRDCFVGPVSCLVK